MEGFTFWFLAFMAAVGIYRLFRKRAATPKARVTALLRRYGQLSRKGLSEEECLLNILATRSGWKALPHRFLREIVNRLRSKEDVFRFMSVSEDYRYPQERFPGIAGQVDLNLAMAQAAGLLVEFGRRLVEQERFKEAEFVEKLAVKLQPDYAFPYLALGETYVKSGQRDEAKNFLRRGLELLRADDRGEEINFSLDCLGLGDDVEKARMSFQALYESCRNAKAKLVLAGMSANLAWFNL